MKIQNIYWFIIFVLTVLSISSCYEVDPLNLNKTTKVYKVTDSITYISDTFTIYGEYLGTYNDNSYLVINDTLKISSNDCVEWDSSKLRFIVPEITNKSFIYVVVNGKEVKYDSLNYRIEIYVFNYPQFDVTKIYPDSFDMGSMEFNIVDEMPVHEVQLTHNLLVANYEVDQRLYSFIMQDNPSKIKQNTLPVYNVEWLEAIDFCNRLSDLDNLSRVYTITDSWYVAFDTASNGWRLPTEAEWEYFSQLNTTSDSLSYYAWYFANSGLNPQQCGVLLPNKYGLYDVLGNVWEWCWDYYKSDYYSSTQFINPKGPTTGTERIYRGGGFDDGKLYVRTQCRRSEKNNINVGFRIVRNI